MNVLIIWTWEQYLASDTNLRPVFYDINTDVILFDRLESVPACTDGETRFCDTGEPGICAAGTQACSDGVWGSCVRNNDPVTEDCEDGLDNDCDGTVDCGDPAEMIEDGADSVYESDSSDAESLEGDPDTDAHGDGGCGCALAGSAG